MVGVLFVALILVMNVAQKSRYELGTLKRKKSSCALKDGHIVNTCNTYFDMKLHKENIYCTIKQNNDTYNNYEINETYKLRNVATSKNFSTCNFGEERYTDNTIYSIGVVFFIIFAMMCCYMCICAKVKHKKCTNEEENITSEIYPIANAERCEPIVISVNVTDEVSNSEYIILQENQLVITNV